MISSGETWLISGPNMNALIECGWNSAPISILLSLAATSLTVLRSRPPKRYWKALNESIQMQLFCKFCDVGNIAQHPKMYGKSELHLYQAQANCELVACYIVVTVRINFEVHNHTEVRKLALRISHLSNGTKAFKIARLGMWKLFRTKNCKINSEKVSWCIIDIATAGSIDSKCAAMRVALWQYFPRYFQI